MARFYLVNIMYYRLCAEFHMPFLSPAGIEPFDGKYAAWLPSL